jgi:peptidoglycan hydrolase-like protein with peptidoglycan-binding domain
MEGLDYLGTDDVADVLGAPSESGSWTLIPKAETGALGNAPSLEDVRAGRGVIKKGMRSAPNGPVGYVQAVAGAIADGVFGPDTEAAVKRFQCENGLLDDGVVGKATLAAMDARAGGAAPGGFSAPARSAPARASSQEVGPAPASALSRADGGEGFERKTSWGTYVAYAFGAAALGIGGYAVFGSKG